MSLWLSNAVELHYFFRRSVRDSLRKSGAGDKDNDGDASPEEEIVVVLEDVVMYSFQQTVYYLTKVGVINQKSSKNGLGLAINNRKNSNATS